MLGNARVNLSSGARVRVKTPGNVPSWSVWDPCQRTSTSTKRRLQEQFFKGDRRVAAEVVYVESEAMRERLRTTGRVKLQLRDAAGQSVVVLAESRNLTQA